MESGINIVIPDNGNHLSMANLLPFLRNHVTAKLSYRPLQGFVNVNFRTGIIDNQNLEILNNPDSIKFVSNKRVWRTTMRRALPDISPKIYIPGKTFCAFPMVLRPDHHLQGRHFYIVRSYTPEEGGIDRSYREMFALIKKHPNISHGIQVIYPNREFRVYCARKFDGKVIAFKTVEKEITYEEDDQDWMNNIKPKNYTLGNSIFKFIKDFIDKPIVRETAKTAFDKSGLHFGAVDVLYRTVDRKPYVIEINSRFAIETDSTIRLFSEFLIEYYRDWEAYHGK